MVQPVRKLKDKEARTSPRFIVGAPVKFSWVDGEQTYSGQGVTRDMSPGSLFIWSESSPPLGLPVSCQVFLSGANISAADVQVAVEGWVFRVEQHAKVNHLVGFVVLNQRISVLAASAS
jgi:hypothetical protein